VFQFDAYERGPRAGAAAVPEPSLVTLLLAGLLSVCTRSCAWRCH
jgi:hypothetical protein